jgi:hypothetical protein
MLTAVQIPLRSHTVCAPVCVRTRFMMDTVAPVAG